MHSSPPGKLKRSRRKQVFLFGLSVVLPALVLLVFIVRMNRQDIELRKKRATEAKQQKAEDIGRHLADELDNTERVILRELTSDPSSLRTIYEIHPELIFIGRVNREKLLMPWERTELQKLSLDGERYGELIHQAQQAEFAQKDLELAESLLDRSLSASLLPSQKCSVQLHLGRVLLKSGDVTRAQKVYKEILGKPGDLADEYGIPFSLFAAERLAVVSSETEPILKKLESLIDETRWFPSRALYLARDVASQLKDKSPGTLLLDRIEDLNQSIEKSLLDIERLESLKGFVSSWILRRSSMEQVNSFSTWQSYGDIPWIVGIRDLSEGQPQAILAFHGPNILRAVIQEAGLADTFPSSYQITVNTTGEGFSLGRAFEGFRLQFDETGVAAWTKSSLPFPILYWSILFLVVGFTAFGGYLLWRDVSRELAIAEMRSHFAASVSHELKTPLTSIRMFAEALTMGVKKEPDAQKEYLQTIISESERLSRLLNNVLDFSKIEQGTRSYRFETTSLEEVIHAAEKAMAFPMDQKGFDLQVEVEEGIPKIQADRDALEQAVLNLLHNAMKYSGESREIRLKLSRNGGMAQVDVTDHGIGIVEENKDRIFGKFFRVQGFENQKIPGTGLGLTIVSHIAQSHGGIVEVVSQPGEGSIFSIILPLEAK